MSQPDAAPGSAEVSVIIVNYGTAELALEAVASVLAQPAGGRAVDVHLVDNASPGADAARLAAAIGERGWGGRVTFYPETENHGFGRGNNLVLTALARRDHPPAYVFLLNPDARLANDAIGLLADFLDTHPEAAVAGARIEKPGGIPVTAAFRFPGIVSTFADAVALGPVARLLARWRVPLPPGQPTGLVDWVSGAAMLMRREAVMQVGGFDPDYFLYHEEVDLMLRLARRGWTTWTVAEALAIHAEGVSTGVRNNEDVRHRRPTYWYESWRIYFRKNHSRAYALAAAAVRIVGTAANQALSALRGHPPAAPLNFFADFWGVACRPLLGLPARHHG